MRAKLLIALTFAASLFISCKKHTVAPGSIFNGKYAGTFTYSNNDPTANYVPLTGWVGVIFNDKHYYSTSPLSMFAAGASGNFINDAKQITFADSTVHPANFDWGIILNGSYTYTTKGDSLFLTKKVSYNIYSYKLVIDRTVFTQ
jgi:hypothetical protein